MAQQPIITFLSDFGTENGYVGAVKGVLKSYNNAIEIIDITHDIESFNIEQAAFTILNYYNKYPKGTVHLVVVDPGVGSERNVIILQTDDYYLVGPDNGIFKYLLRQDHPIIYKVDPDSIYKNEKGATFHARDIFAPVSAKLALGERAESIGTKINNLIIKSTAKKIVPNEFHQLEIKSITYDKFGNIIFNYMKADLEERTNHQIKSVCFKNFESDQIYDYYSQVTKGSPLFLWNSLGFLELSICQGSAKDYFSWNKADKAIIIFK